MKAHYCLHIAGAAAAKSLQSCLTLCNPIDGSPPGSPSLGFSRQEQWSGLPFLSPMHESEKWKWKGLQDLDNHDGVITHREPDILECEVKWALGSITTNKASGGNRIPVELFQILKDDAVKVLHAICQQIWKTQQWPQDWKMSFFIPIPKKGKQRMLKLLHNCTHLTHL